MNGDKLIDEFKRRIMKERGTKSVSDSVLAKWLGVTQPQLGNYRDKVLTSRKVANLMDKFAKRKKQDLVDEAGVPIVEFFTIEDTESRGGQKWELFSGSLEDGSAHPYLSGLREELSNSNGIYVFHDSRGRAIYAGKAVDQSLWLEMKNAYNRDRGRVQNIKRVKHPSGKVSFDINKVRKIEKSNFQLHEVAFYFSAYRVPRAFISKFEALIIRAFANDLLNTRMENIKR